MKLTINKDIKNFNEVDFINRIRWTLEDSERYEVGNLQEITRLEQVLQLLENGGVISNGDIAEVTSIINDINGAVSDIVYNEM